MKQEVRSRRQEVSIQRQEVEGSFGGQEVTRPGRGSKKGTAEGRGIACEGSGRGLERLE